MTRSFLPTPVAPEVVDSIIDLARRSPSAGNTEAVSYLVLEGRDTDRYWETTLSAERRADFAWPGLLAAPVLVVPWVDPAAYVSRYAESDKARTGLGDGVAQWPVPYWWVDGGMAAMVVLLGAQARGLGALFFGLFDHEDAVRDCFAVPSGHRAVGAVAIGNAAPEQRPSRSSSRGRPELAQVIHRGRW